METLAETSTNEFEINKLKETVKFAKTAVDTLSARNKKLEDLLKEKDGKLQKQVEANDLLRQGNKDLVKKNSFLEDLITTQKSILEQVVTNEDQTCMKCAATKVDATTSTSDLDEKDESEELGIVSPTKKQKVDLESSTKKKKEKSVKEKEKENEKIKCSKCRLRRIPDEIDGKENPDNCDGGRPCNNCIKAHCADECVTGRIAKVTPKV